MCSFTFWFLQVIDNGVGIAFDDVKLVGSRHATSKSSASSYGRKGAALASIAAVAGTLEITTRHKLSTKTFNKVFHLGKEGPVVESELSRPSAGSTMTVYDLFYNLPVRRKSLCESMVLVKVTQAVSAVALLHPSISFSVRNNQTGDCLLQTSRVSSVQHTFAHLFGDDCSLSLKCISVSCNDFNISGHISTDGHTNGTLQFLYLNGRLIHKTQLHTFLNSLLTKQLFNNFQQADTSSQVTVLQEKFGVYVIDIRCPFSKYDICHEPSKTLIEFIDWTHVHNALQLLIVTFLEQNNLAAKPLKMTSQCPKDLPNSISRPVCDGRDTILCGLQSQTVRRCSSTTSDGRSSADLCIISPCQTFFHSSEQLFQSRSTLPAQVSAPTLHSCEDSSPVIGSEDSLANTRASGSYNSLQKGGVDSSWLCAKAIRCQKRSTSLCSGLAAKISKLTSGDYEPKCTPKSFSSPLLFSQIGSRLSSLHCPSTQPDLAHTHTPSSVSTTALHNTELVNTGLASNTSTLPAASFLRKPNTKSSTSLMHSSMFITPFTPVQPASSQAPFLSKPADVAAWNPQATSTTVEDKENRSGGENLCPYSKPEIPAPLCTNKPCQTVREILSSWENPAFRANDRVSLMH